MARQYLREPCPTSLEVPTHPMQQQQLAQGTKLTYKREEGELTEDPSTSKTANTYKILQDMECEVGGGQSEKKGSPTFPKARTPPPL